MLIILLGAPRLSRPTPKSMVRMPPALAHCLLRHKQRLYWYL